MDSQDHRPFSKTPLSLQNFRSSRDGDDNSSQDEPCAAAVNFSADCGNLTERRTPSPCYGASCETGFASDVDSDDDDDDDDDAYAANGLKSSFSSSSSSPFRSCKSSLSPQASNSVPENDTEPTLSQQKLRESVESDQRLEFSAEDDVTDEYYSDDEAVQERGSSVVYCHDEYFKQVMGWKGLPANLLEDVFVLLSPKQRHQASMVCWPWYEVFYSPRVWETFVLFERTLTKKRFNLYKGYQRELCPRKTQICLMRVGCFFKRIVVTPITDYYNLYEFLRVLSSFLAFHADFPMPLLHTFRFTFACESRGVNGVIIIGTGGNILEKLKDLVSNMKQLRHLALNELLLDVEEVPGLLVASAKHCSDSLRSLELLNCSKVPYPICEVTQFYNLVRLKLSPQHLNEEVVLLLGGTQLLQLHIVQDAYTCSCSPVPGEVWKLFKDMAPNKRVFLEVQGLTKTPLLLQPHAPVHGVIFRTSYHRLDHELTTWILEFYSKYLEYFVQECLPRAHSSRKFSERADECFLRLVRACPRLHTLVIRERISLATLLLLAKEGRTLRSFMVRKNALIKKCEWPKAENWSHDFYIWLKTNGRDYAKAFEQMPLVLKRRWKPTIDRVFKHVSIQVT